MIPLPLADVAGALGLPPAPGASGGPVIHAVSTDSRNVPAGALFVALPGVRTDGADHAGEAVGAGAVAVLAARPLPVPVPVLVVPDPLAALARLAADQRNRLPARVLGVTGSSGKTTTKDLLAALLESLGPTVSPPGSFNNELGLPLTVLQAGPDTRFLVLEMGARGPGHIAELARIARPHAGVLLNVGSAHLEMFGSRERIAAAKGELVEAATDYAVLNRDDPLVLACASRAPGAVVTVSARGDRDADLWAENVRLDASGRPRFTLHSAQGRAEVELALVGEHQVANALSAVAAALREGVDLSEVPGLLAAAAPRSRWRMEPITAGNGAVILNDAYNANPESMQAALRTLVGLGQHREGRTVAVLGAMRELGAGSQEAHEALGGLAARLGIDLLVAVGSDAAGIARGARQEAPWAGEAVPVPDVAAALSLLEGRLGPRDVVLIKASRSESLERLAASLAGGAR